MSILGCRCLNVLIHIERTTNVESSGLTGVQLTLDGINVQQEFLVHRIKRGDWTTVNCMVCDMPTHRNFNQEFQVYPGLEDYSNTVMEVQNRPQFSASFNLILPERVERGPDETSALTDLKVLQSEVSRIKQDMKMTYEEKIANFISREKEILETNFQMVESAEQKIRGLVNQYHQNNRPDLTSLINPVQPLPSALTTSSSSSLSEKTRKSSLSDRKVTFSTSDDIQPGVEVAWEKENRNEEHVPKSPLSQEEYFQFDMGDDDLFMTPMDHDILGNRMGILGLGDDPSDEEDRREEEEDEDDRESSSSGCEADMVTEGKSVPINIPANYRRDHFRSKRLSSSTKGEDVAHSMKTMMEAFNGGPENDIPRPRLVSKSYNPSRIRHS